MTHILFNPLSNNKNGKVIAEQLVEKIGSSEAVLEDVTQIPDAVEYLVSMPAEESVILCGGDGTINFLANFFRDKKVSVDAVRCSILYHAAGSGNDFAREFTEDKMDENGCIDLKPYIVNLPTVTVKGKTSLFLNGIGYGIDGYCCRVGDDIRATSTGDKPINYAAIAIKGIFFHFKPANATVTVDGQVHKFKKVWLAPTMNGNYYGGGMKITPQQDRLNKERTVTLAVWHTTGAIKTLMMFPKIFEGLLSQYPKYVSYFTGKQVKVEFDSPRDLQIDGETVRDVSEYSVNC